MAVSQKWETYAPRFQALAQEELTPNGVGDWLTRWSDLEKTLGEVGAAIYRAKSEDTANAKAEQTFLHWVTEVQPQWEVAVHGLQTKLLAVADYQPAPDHVQLLRRLRSDQALFREENVPLQAELQTLANEYDKIFGAMAVTLDGAEMTLPQAGQKLEDPDRGVRERAWRAIQGHWLQDRPALDTLYLQMLPLRRQMARHAGQPDFRAYMWQALHRFDYTPEDSLAFHEAIEAEFVPLATKLRQQRGRQLGLDVLRPWDLDVDPASAPALRPFADVAELEETTTRIFAQVDPVLGTEFQKLRPGFLDLGSRKGKAPGGYCSFFPETGLPYIFMNAVGTQDDVRTLLHEGGHAFHDLASSAAQPLIWNEGAPTEFAEVASMSMELLASPYLEKDKGGFYAPADAARARQEHLESIVQFLPYMAVVDAFQHWVYSEAPENVTAPDMDACWDRLWARFMPGVDWSGLENERQTGWHRKLHIFEIPFYYVEYGLAQLGALQVWRNALADQAQSVRQYRAALALGNTRPLPELYEAAGARLAFDRATVGELARLVAAHLEI